MGKSLKTANLVKRTGKMAFWGVGASVSATFARMEGFTELTTSRNATEYERQYVDEDFKRTDVTGYNTSKSYAFDRYKGNAVLDDIINITENELTGLDAVREVIIVDMTTVTKGTDNKYHADAYRRQFSVVPDSDGDTTDCMTYSGNLKARGEMEKIQVTSVTADWDTCYAGLDTDIPLLTSMTVSGATFDEPAAFDASTFYYQMTSTSGTVTITTVSGTTVEETYMVNGVSVTSLSAVKLNDGLNSIVIMLNKNGVYSTYSITVSYEA